MSRLYDTVEPSIVDDEMLSKAVEEQGPKEEAGRVAKQEGIDFKDVTALRLDFKNILKIDNLWCFTSLVKLQLDNNIIEKIEGLSMLVNLVWLDLSFNNIEAIEGLDQLTKLEDLTLYNNRIHKIEGLDNMENLHVFSVGNNQLRELDNFVYLRRFKKLQTLNIAGNPVCEDEEYRVFIVAHLPALEYLNYRLIAETDKISAKEKFEIAIQEIEHEERSAERKREAREAKLKERLLHESAYVENLNGPMLFEAMYEEDPEGNKLNELPGLEEHLLVYREKFTGICQEVFSTGLQRQKERQADVDMFWECVREAKEENRKQGAVAIETFMSYKRKLWSEMNQTSDDNSIELHLSDYNQQVSELWDRLMALEMQLVDQLDDSIKDFERNMADMVATFIETVQNLISQCRDLENMHHERLMELAVITLEKVVKNEMDEELTDDLRELFVDKDTLINAVSSSHDLHLLKIDSRVDDIVTKINQWMTNLIESIHDTEEIQRNRQRVSEINNLIDHLRDEMDNFESERQNY